MSKLIARAYTRTSAAKDNWGYVPKKKLPKSNHYSYSLSGNRFSYVPVSADVQASEGQNT